MRWPVLVVGAVRMLVCALVGVVLVLVASPVALAAVGHEFLSSVSEASLGTSLIGPGAVAVDGSSGELFVGDASAGVVYVYSSSGAFVGQFGGGALDPVGIAVDEANGLVFVADERADAVFAFRPDGGSEYGLVAEWYGEKVPGGEFGDVTGVAVDNSHSASAGDVYVVDGKSLAGGVGALDVFEPKPAGVEEAAEGTLVRSITAGRMEDPNGVAVDRSTGRVLVADSVKGAVFAFSATGALEEKWSGKGSPFGSFAGKEAARGNVSGVGVDDATGDVYVAEAERHVVSQYGPDGVWEGWIGQTPAGALGEPRGVAPAAGGDVYVADARAGVVDRFGPDVVVPGVETGKVARSAITRTTVTFTGTIDGAGSVASYRFQYGETEALGGETTAQAGGGGEQAVSGTAGGLQAGTVYFYRIVGENENGASYGLIRSVETAPAIDGLETGPATGVTSQGATLAGSLQRDGLATRYYFQYGPTTAYGTQQPEPAGEVPAAGGEKGEKQPRTLQSALPALEANTTYHYRLVAENSYGTTYGQDSTFTTSGPPRVTPAPVTNVGQHEATVHAQLDPDQLDTTYRFEYGETTGYGSQTGPAGAGAGASFEAVGATLTSLRVGTTYHYRLVAENEAGTSTGPDETFTTVAAAAIDASYATSVTATQAVLHAQIDALGNDTHYYFQYGPQPCQANPRACTDTATPPGEDLGAGVSDAAGEAGLSGLAPGTTYRFRVIASNGLGVSEGPEQTFTTQAEAGSFTLPDGRAWELVTPPDKGGAPVEALTREGGVILAAEDGDALTYVTDGALGENVGGNRSPELQQILATRTPTGWSSQDIANPNTKAKGVTAGEAPEYQYFSSDLSRALVEPVGQGAEPPLVEGITQATVYIRDNATGTYLPLVSEGNVAPGVNFSAKVHIVSASPDLSHVVLRSAVALTAGRSQPGLYEWAGGKLQYVSVLPGGRPARGAEPEVGYLHDPDNAISSDGSRIIWTLPTGSAEASRGHLYLRDVTRGETIQLDAAQGVAEPEQGSAQYQTASSDGSRVFFTDEQRLTADSTASPAKGEEQADLYECQIVESEGRLACELHDLTVDRHAGEHAAVQGLVLGASQDGADVYLVAHGVLADNANGNGETAQPGADNLYQLQLDGGEWTRTFIAGLSSQDKPEWEGADLADTAYLTARVSPNGRYLAFMSAAPITGYDNTDASSAAEGARDEEVYLYDSVVGSLRCVSCNPSGARPAGVLDTVESGEGLGLTVDRREIWLGHWLAGNIPGWTAESLPTPGEAGALFQSRYLSDQGRLYFNSPDALVPAATNGKEDVYEYEPAGVGSCQSATGGCVALISSGTSSRESAFLEATPDGSDVFFLTEAQLSSQDTDTAFDIYDARECSQSSPCLSPPQAPAPACGETTTCRAAQPSQQPAGVDPATATSAGPGNISPSATPPAKHASEAAKTVKAKPLTRAQKLRRALDQCHRSYRRAKQRRVACERRARKRYGAKHKAHRSKKTSGANGPTGRRGAK